jgi:hypothetical protein
MELNREKEEVECPVCDRKISADAKTCTGCGADFSSSGVDELEQVARDLRNPIISPPVTVAQPVEYEAPRPHEPQKVADEKKDNLLGRFFKKKK